VTAASVNVASARRQMSVAMLRDMMELLSDMRTFVTEMSGIGCAADAEARIGPRQVAAMVEERIARKSRTCHLTQVVVG
jgi:hypothetical protein